MAERSVNLMEVVSQCGDQDLLRQLAETTLAKLMEFEVAQLIGADRHERSGERVFRPFWSRAGSPSGSTIS